MPEGPPIVILKETITPLFKGKKIIKAFGNAKIEKQPLVNKKLLDLKSWGKQLFLCFPDNTVRIHFLLFGSYSLNTQTKPDRGLRLALLTTKNALYFYTCSVKLLPKNIDALCDWEADVLSDRWNPVKARKKLKAMPRMMVCDALLDQQVFSGVGNIIKNEVLFRIRVHPETLIKHLPSRMLTNLVKEARKYSFDFMAWKKEFVLKKNWQVHTKKICPRCNLTLIKKYCGKTRRRTFFCANCQVKYK